MEFLFALHYPKEFHNPPYGKSHAMSILPVCSIESRGTVFHLTRQKREVHLPGGREIGGKSVSNITNERYQLFESIVYESRSW